MQRHAKPVGRTPVSAATVVRLAVIAGGAALAVFGAFVFDVASGTDGGVAQWLPSGASAAAGWVTLVLLADTAWEVGQILSGRVPVPIGEIGTINETLRRFLAPALLAAGIILGYFFFK